MTGRVVMKRNTFPSAIFRVFVSGVLNVLHVYQFNGRSLFVLVSACVETVTRIHGWRRASGDWQRWATRGDRWTAEHCQCVS